MGGVTQLGARGGACGRMGSGEAKVEFLFLP
jgi:hypothetical protein